MSDARAALGVLALRVRGGGCCQSTHAVRGGLATDTASGKVVVRDVPRTEPPSAPQAELTPPAAPTTPPPATAPTAATDAAARAASAEWRLEVIQRAMEVQRAGSSDYAGAEFLFGPAGLPPSYWGVSKEQLLAFRSEVEDAVARGRTGADGLVLRNTGRFPYPQERFDDPVVGPNMYQVTDQYLKPLTKAHAQLPGLSYALMHNLTRGGLRCDLFFSHVWSEGVYEFIDHALAAWPDGCEGAYICTLSNPQNLDIGTLLGSAPRASPFFKVLSADPPPRMLMLANRHTPIHERLWCVYEAFLANEKEIVVRIAGEALHLLSGDLAEFLRLKEDAAKRMIDEARAPVTEAVASLEAQGAAALHTLLPRVDAAFEEVARAKLRMLRAEDATLVDFERASCF